MSTDSDNKSGIPTRAMHEAYLDMQRALKRYRQATDRGTESEISAAHGDVQEAVLTFYEMLRPHLKHNDAVADYWEGELPTYNGGSAPDPENGKAVLQVQNHMDVVPYENIDYDEAGEDVESVQDLDKVERLENWHHILRLNGNVRLRGIQFGNGGIVASYDAYQLGMRHLDNWETEYRTVQKTLDGFLEGTSEEETERVRVDMAKLKRAARELGDIAERLGALSTFDASTPRTEITDDLVEEVEEWRQRNLE